LIFAISANAKNGHVEKPNISGFEKILSSGQSARPAAIRPREKVLDSDLTFKSYRQKT
jgi:hypothetical protein